MPYPRHCSRRRPEGAGQLSALPHAGLRDAEAGHQYLADQGLDQGGGRHGTRGNMAPGLQQQLCNVCHGPHVALPATS